MEGNFPSPHQHFDTTIHSGIIEISVIVATGAELDFKDIFHSLVLPAGCVHRFVRRNIHGLSQRRLSREQSWDKVRARLNNFFQHSGVSLVLGVGEDILWLLPQFPALANAAYCDLQLPQWRQREVEPYSASHAVLWQRYSRSRRPACADRKHAAYKPSIAYRGKSPHKLWYGPHCALKDCFYMLCAARMGVQAAAHPRGSVHLSVQPTVPSLEDQQIALEGLQIDQPEFEASAIHLAGQFIRRYAESTPHARLPMQAPWFAPLLGANLPQEEVARILSRIFNQAAQHEIVYDYRHNQRTAISYPLLRQIATALGHANLCTIEVDPGSLPVRSLLVASTEAHRVLPPGANLCHLPRDWVSALRTLRQIRATRVAALTGRVVVENIFRSMAIGRARRLCQQLRSLFGRTPVVVIVHRNYELASRLRSLQAKYRIQVLLLRDPESPTALQDNFPSLFRLD